jgi:OCT family organic cation transporter-like MFS transporter 4/5
MSEKEANPGAIAISIQANCSSIQSSATQQEAPSSAPYQQQHEEGVSQKRLLAGASTGRQGLTLDEALTKYIGDFGRGQLFIWTLASLFWIPNAVVILLLVFTLGSPVADRAWECVNPTDTLCQQALASSTPATAFCSLGQDQWRWTNTGHSLVATFNLTCTQAWKTQLANSFFFVGYLIGSGLFGYLADAYGRKPMLFASTAWSALFTAACIGATNYWVLMVLRLLAGIGVAGQALTCYILATEMIGPSRRGIAGIITQVRLVVRISSRSGHQQQEWATAAVRA